ncbi:MAG: response regulator [Bacteroidia bacterium]|jgi:YesN/AraC family two-component response regulator|nr:response regulator [Bacteroidia bacterium]
MRIILIDDEWNSLDLLEKMVRTVDAELQIIGKFQNPLEAIPHILSGRPDVLLLDVEMPLLNGIDMIRMLAHTSCHFVIVTGGDASHWIEEYKLERTFQLHKPFSINELRSVFSAIARLSKTTANKPDA